MDSVIDSNFTIFKDGEGDWVSLDAELEMSDGVVTGTRCPTGHYLLIDARFELPFGELIILLLCFLQTIIFPMIPNYITMYTYNII